LREKYKETNVAQAVSLRLAERGKLTVCYAVLLERYYFYIDEYNYFTFKDENTDVTVEQLGAA